MSPTIVPIIVLIIIIIIIIRDDSDDSDDGDGGAGEAEQGPLSRKQMLPRSHCSDVKSGDEVSMK